tara:strand:+ start:5089 stop:6054 length:966 start_codon:yes stop_codon:yes gene_type:complete
MRNKTIKRAGAPLRPMQILAPNESSEGSSYDTDDSEDDQTPIITLNMTINLEEQSKFIPENALTEIYENRTDKTPHQLDFIIGPTGNIFSTEYNVSKTKTKPRFNEYPASVGLLSSKIKLKYLTGKKDFPSENNFIKLFLMPIVYDNGFITEETRNLTNISLSKILSEVYFQLKAENPRLQKNCSYSTSKIKSYGFVTAPYHNDHKIFYILYNNLGHLKTLQSLLDSPNCHQIIKKVQNIDDCLARNNLYHNDLTTPDNILLDSNNNIYIIDYGESSNERIKSARFNYPECTYKFDHWTQAIGGKKSKKRTSKNKKSKKRK